MNQFEITTAQNVTIRLTIANMGDRILAAFIDLCILGGYVFLLSYIYSKVESDLIDGFSSKFTFWLFFGLSLPIYFYSLLFEFFWHGQTPGKRLRKIRVVRMDGESLTIGNCIIRWLLKLVDVWLDSGSVGIVTATFSATHQRIGDMVAGTIVINTRADQARSLSEYAEVPVEGHITFPQAERLKLSDMETLAEVLRLYYENDIFDPILLASARLKEVMEVMPEMDDLSFVKTVLGDYNQMHRIA